MSLREWKENWTRHQQGPLHSDVFRKINTLQLHAPLDKHERDRMHFLRQCDHAEARAEEAHATRVRHALNVIIGVAVGTVAVAMRVGYMGIWSRRTEAVLQLLGEGSAGTAGLVAAVITTMLALAASALVAWQPASASSGIPGVIAYLNGVDLNHALGPRVLTAKILGTILAVGSGLAVGPEGPMIHIGAMVGRLAVHGFVRPVLRCMGERVRHLVDELERQPMRYDVQAAAMGAGAGIAAAFQAPLAGTVFVVEEAASFFSKRLFLHTFICCASAFFTTLLLDALTQARPHHFYARTPQCDSAQMWSSLLLLQVALMGVLCGLLGWCFNRAVVAIAKASAAQAYRLGQGWPLRRRRFAFVAAVSVFGGVLTVALAANGPCMDASMQQIFTGSSGCISEEWMSQLLIKAKAMPAGQLHYGFRAKPEGPMVMAYLPAPGLFGAQFDPVLCPIAINKTRLCRIPNIERYLDPSHSPDYYCCSFNDMSALDHGVTFSFLRPSAPLQMSREQWPRGSCSAGHNDSDNNVYIEHYSPSASMVFTEPASTVRNLLVRGAPQVLPAGDLALYLGSYGVLTVLGTAVWVPGGLLVPMMIIGSAAGRLWGLMWAWALQESGPRRPQVLWIPEIQPLIAMKYPNTKDSTPGMPPEPGILALAGCAAFLSGSGALALFVIVLLVEITLEPFLIPVVIIAVLAARGVASVLHSKGLYHDLINVQSLPFLHEHHHWRQEHYLVTDVLKQDVATTRGDGEAFPTEPQDWGATTRGERETTPSDSQDWTLFESPRDAAGGSHRSLEELQQAREIVVTVQDSATGDEVVQLLDDHPMVNGFPVVEQQGRLVGLVTRAALEHLLERSPPRGGEQRAGVEQVMDQAPFVVPACTHLKHAHMLFYNCGLRHLVVVDGQHQPVGLLTRKSLMPWRVPPPESFGDAGNDTFVEPRNAHTPIYSPSRESMRRSLG